MGLHQNLVNTITSHLEIRLYILKLFSNYIEVTNLITAGFILEATLIFVHEDLHLLTTMFLFCL